MNCGDSGGIWADSAEDDEWRAWCIEDVRTRRRKQTSHCSSRLHEGFRSIVVCIFGGCCMSIETTRYADGYLIVEFLA